MLGGEAEAIAERLEQTLPGLALERALQRGGGAWPALAAALPPTSRWRSSSVATAAGPSGASARTRWTAVLGGAPGQPPSPRRPAAAGRAGAAGGASRRRAGQP